MHPDASLASHYRDLSARISDRLDRDAEVEPSAFADYQCARGYHESLKADDALWSRLPNNGVQLTRNGALELRTCPGCHSTLGRKVSGIDATERGQ